MDTLPPILLRITEVITPGRCSMKTGLAYGMKCGLALTDSGQVTVDDSGGIRINGAGSVALIAAPRILKASIELRVLEEPIRPVYAERGFRARGGVALKNCVHGMSRTIKPCSDAWSFSLAVQRMDVP